MRKDLNATEDCKTEVELHLLSEFSPKTSLCTFHFLYSPLCPPYPSAHSRGEPRHLPRPGLALTNTSLAEQLSSVLPERHFPRWDPGENSWTCTISGKRETQIWIDKRNKNQGSQLYTQTGLINVCWLVEGLVDHVFNKEVELDHN